MPATYGQPNPVTYSSRAMDLVNKTHRQIYEVWAWIPGGQLVQMDTERCQITWDESRSPRVQMSVTCRVPDQALLDQLDPRVGVRLRLYAGYEVDGTREFQYIANLNLTQRWVTRPDNLLEMEACSDEVLITEMRAWRPWTRAGSTPLWQAIYSLIQESTPSNPQFFYTLPDGYRIMEDLDIEKGGDYWGPMMDLVDREDAELYDDGRRNWVLRWRPATKAPEDGTLIVGDGGTVITSSTMVERTGEWANRVMIRYAWSDGGTENVIWGESNAVGSMAFSVVGGKTYTENRTDIRISQTAANAAARNLLKRRLAHGRSFTLRSTSYLWLRPGMSVRVQLATGGLETHLVSSVMFDLDNGWMDLKTRLPDMTNVPGE